MRNLADAVRVLGSRITGAKGIVARQAGDGIIISDGRPQPLWVWVTGEVIEETGGYPWEEIYQQSEGVWDTAPDGRSGENLYPSDGAGAGVGEVFRAIPHSTEEWLIGLRAGDGGDGQIEEAGYLRYLSDIASTNYPSVYPAEHGVVSFNETGNPTWTLKLIWAYPVNGETPITGRLFDAQISKNRRKLDTKYVYTSTLSGSCCLDDHPCEEETECWNPFLQACVCCFPDCCEEQGYLCWNPTFGTCVPIDSPEDCPETVTCTPDGINPCNGFDMTTAVVYLDGVAQTSFGWSPANQQWEGEIANECNPDLLPNGVLVEIKPECISGEATITVTFGGETYCTPEWNLSLVQCNPLIIRGYVIWRQYPGPGAPDCPCIGFWQLVEVLG